MHECPFVIKVHSGEMMLDFLVPAVCSYVSQCSAPYH